MTLQPELIRQSEKVLFEKRPNKTKHVVKESRSKRSQRTTANEQLKDEQEQEMEKEKYVK